MESTFIRFGTAHLIVLFLTVAIPVVLIAWVKIARSNMLAKHIALTIGSLLLANEIFAYLWKWHLGTIWWGNGIPMHLCDWATILAVITCYQRKQWSYELTYFWGLAGTAQAVITPDLRYGFPSPSFFIFFICHAGLVATILYLTFAFPLRPTWSSIPRAYGWLLFYAACTGVVNSLLGTNYGYTCAKPAVASMMDYFGPWPWYIAVMTVVAAVFFVVYYLPFAIADAVKKRTTASL